MRCALSGGFKTFQRKYRMRVGVVYKNARAVMPWKRKQLVYAVYTSERGKRENNNAKAIRAKCLDCCGGSIQEVRLCTCGQCALYRFRFGKNPNHAGIGRNPRISEKTTTQQAKNTQSPIA